MNTPTDLAWVSMLECDRCQSSLLLAALPVQLHPGAVAVPSYMKTCLSLSTGTGSVPCLSWRNYLFPFPRGDGALVSFPRWFNFCGGSSSGALLRLCLQLALGHPWWHPSLVELRCLHWEERATGKGIAGRWCHEEDLGRAQILLAWATVRSAVGEARVSSMAESWLLESAVNSPAWPNLPLVSATTLAIVREAKDKGILIHSVLLKRSVACSVYTRKQPCVGYPVGVLAFDAGPSKNFCGSSFMKSDIHDRPIAVVR